MEDLIPPQIKDSCKLAVPDGLKELMSDITRELWRDKKQLAKKAAAAAQRSASATGGGPSTALSLSQWELKIVSIMGDEFGEPQTSARSQAFVEHPSQETAAAASTCTPANQEDLSLLNETQTQQETIQQASAPPGSNASTTRSQLTSTRQRRESRRHPETLQTGSSVRDRLFRLEERRSILEEQRNAELAGIRMAVLELCGHMQQINVELQSRVLRYQPRDLYKFIADYLSAMLITRDNLSIAGYICNDIANCSCEPELHTELREIGLPEDDIETARDIIVNYLEKGKVDEGNLLMILIKDTKINEDMLPAVQDAIRNAYLRHQAHNTTKYESSDSEQDDMICAAKHTLDLYRKTAPNKETYGIMAEKIQKSYRAYGVRRDSALKNKNTKPVDKAVTLVDPKNKAEMSNSYDIAFPKMKYSEEAISMGSSAEDPEIQMSSSMNKKRIVTMSSTSLAGSFMTLPSYKPYSAHDCDILSNLDEFPEREHAHIDYTADNPHFSMVTEDKLFYKRVNKKISFNEAAKKMGLEADDDSESKDSDQNVSMNGADSDTFYRGDVMRIESNNYDGDTEMERSDVNVSGSYRKH